MPPLLYKITETDNGRFRVSLNDKIVGDGMLSFSTEIEAEFFCKALNGAASIGYDLGYRDAQYDQDRLFHIGN